MIDIKHLIAESLINKLQEETIVNNGKLGNYGHPGSDPGADKGWEKHDKHLSFTKKHAVSPTKYKNDYGRKTGKTTLNVDGHIIKHKYASDLDDYNRGTYSNSYTGTKEALQHLKDKHGIQSFPLDVKKDKYGKK
jgi:hypothetical protein